MKDGKRPESPTTKVKTILEKKKEEQERSRMERAARRIGNKLDLNGDAGSVDSGDLEMRDISMEPTERRHPRGAGEDEEYESPTRPKREYEDMDLDLDSEGMMEEGNGARRKKRVKWNKDLWHRFDLDESDFEGIRKGAEIARMRAASKSCLTAQVLIGLSLSSFVMDWWLIATQVILDSLGNVPEAELPVAGLQKEQVVVTKLVYIEDLPPSERPKRVAATKANARIGLSWGFTQHTEIGDLNLSIYYSWEIF